MKIYITGASGFIGKHLVRRLSQTEHKMVCLVRKTSDVSELEQCGATMVIGDVTDKASLLDGMAGCDWLVNLANLYSFWEPDKRRYWETNVVGTRNVLECALDSGISKVAHISSAIIYGKPVDCQFTEESPVGPVRFSEYARTKYQGDLIAWQLFEQRGLPMVVIYPTVVLGPGNEKPSGEYIQNYISARLPGRTFENSTMTYVHACDVAEVIVRALEKDGNIGEKYLVGNVQLSYMEYNRLISEISGAPAPKISLPDWLVRINAALLTAMADLTKRPPPWGLSNDCANTNINGIICDGSKAERELNITYTPVRGMLEEAITSYRGNL